LYQLDEQMRQELAELKLSVDKDKGGKTKANAKVLTAKMVVSVHICLSE